MSKVAFWCTVIVFLAASIVGCMWIKSNYPDFFYNAAVSFGIKQDQEEEQNQDYRLQTSQSPTESTTPDKNQQDLNNTIPQTGIFGLPGLGLPSPLPAGNPSTPGAAVPTTGQPSEDMANTGASLDQIKLQSPEDVLKACVANLKRNDIVGCERYVSSNGLSFTLGTTVGVHEVLWKGLFQVQAYQNIGYDAIKISGQTALVPLYANLGENKTIVAYVVMAHRGDGWKLDHITDPSRF